MLDKLRLFTITLFVCDDGGRCQIQGFYFLGKHSTTSPALIS